MYNIYRILLITVPQNNGAQSLVHACIGVVLTLERIVIVAVPKAIVDHLYV